MPSWGNNALRYLQQHNMQDFGNIQLQPASAQAPYVAQTPQPAQYNWETGLNPGGGGGNPGGAAQIASANQTQQDVNVFNQQGGHGGNQGRPGTGGGAGGRGAGNATTPQPSVNPGDYSSDLVGGSNEWYGKLNDYGVQTALGSPQGFWGGYGSNVQGWDPTGNAASFMANLYSSPGNLVASLNPQANGPWGNERTLAGETGLANQLSGDYANFFNVGGVMSGVLHAIATNDDNALGNINPVLATMIQQNKGNPAGQVNSIVDFFKSILPSMMPQDMAQALITQIQAVGNKWAMSLGQGGQGSMGRLDAANFAQYLMQTMGPALGIS